jgi:hypothetical protein
MAHGTPPWAWFGQRLDMSRSNEVGIMSATHVVHASHALDDPHLRSVWMERIGGVAAILLAVGYVATMPLFASVGAPPEGAHARLEYHVTGTDTWWVIVALSVLTDLLFVPVAISLYTVLRRLSQPVMLFASAFIMIFVVLDLAVLWPAKVSMITLGEAYGTATSEQRALLLVAAGYPSSVLDSDLTAVYSILTLGIGILGTGLVMLRGAFGRATAIVGVATGIVSIASVIETMVTGAFPMLVVGASLLTIVWIVMVGRALLRSRWSPAGASRQLGPAWPWP